MKKLLSIILACVVAISLFGCGDSGSEQINNAGREVKDTLSYKYGDSLKVLNVIDFGEQIESYGLYDGHFWAYPKNNPSSGGHFDIKGNKFNYEDKYFAFQENKKRGLRVYGKDVLKAEYDDVYTSGEYIYTRKSDDFCILDENLKVIYKCKTTRGLDKSVSDALKLDNADYQRYRHIHLQNGLINMINDKNMWGYVDINGKTVIDFNYYYAKPYDKNYSNVVGKNKEGEYKWGLIDGDGNLIIDYQYDTALQFSNGISKANKDGIGYYINIRNEQVLNGLLFEETKTYYEGLASVKKNSKWGYIDTNGREVFPCIFDDVQEYAENGLMVARYKNCIVILTYLDPSELGFTDADVDNAYAKLNQIDGSSYWTDLRRKQENKYNKENWNNKDYEDDFNYTLTYKEVQPNTWYVTDAGVWYYFENDRTTRKTGWYNEPKDGQTYYLNPSNGAMVTGWTEIDGNKYYFHEGHSSTPNWYYIPESDSWESHGNNVKSYGALYKDETTPDGKKVDKDGKLIGDGGDVVINTAKAIDEQVNVVSVNETDTADVIRENLKKYKDIKDGTTNSGNATLYNNYRMDCKVDIDGRLYIYEMYDYEYNDRVETPRTLTIYDTNGQKIVYYYSDGTAFQSVGEKATINDEDSDVNEVLNVLDNYFLIMDDYKIVSKKYPIIGGADGIRNLAGRSLEEININDDIEPKVITGDRQQLMKLLCDMINNKEEISLEQNLEFHRVLGNFIGDAVAAFDEEGNLWVCSGGKIATFKLTIIDKEDSSKNDMYVNGVPYQHEKDGVTALNDLEVQRMLVKFYDVRKKNIW